MLWASDKKGNGYGNGKTMLAKCARQALVMGGMSVVSIVFTTSEKFLDDVKSSYDSHSTTHTFKMYRAAPAVIVDDFGTEYFKELGWYQEQWYKLLNHAYDARQPFMLTSNLQPGEMQERLGGKNWSRLEGHAGRAFVNMSALPDRRVK